MLGKAAVTIWCDVSGDVRDEFDDWHAHEHMQERLSIPGFRRGSRWVADEGEGYFMLYEATDEATITGGAYLERLNAPTRWSRKMMPHHRNMVRSLCRVDAAFGEGLGQALLTVRFSPDPGRADKLLAWLKTELLPGLPARKGLVAAHLLRNIAPPGTAQTAEQKLRGGDAAADWIVLVVGYGPEAVASVAAGKLSQGALGTHGAAPGAIAGRYHLAYVLTEKN
jgi:hypothetical protein